MRAVILFFFLVTYINAICQDGKIVEQSKYSLPDSIFPSGNKPVAHFYSITYLSDSLKIKGFIAIPETSNPHPCVIINRGGNGSYAMLTQESFAKKAQFLLANGYTVAASQYRGSTGSEGSDEFGGGDVNDVLNLITALKFFPGADTTRVGLFGWSRGAINTYVALTRSSNIKAVVVGGGFSDLLALRDWRKAFDSLLYARLIPGYGETKNEALLKERSAYYITDKFPKTVPILLLHGSADGNVPVIQSLHLAQKFYETRVPFRLIVYEGGIHSLDQFKAEYEMEIIKWFNQYLRDGKPPPGLEPVFKR